MSALCKNKLFTLENNNNWMFVSVLLPEKNKGSNVTWGYWEIISPWLNCSCGILYKVRDEKYSVEFPSKYH